MINMTKIEGQPTEDGYYWYVPSAGEVEYNSDFNEPQPVSVYRGNVELCGSLRAFRVSLLDGTWYRLRPDDRSR